MHVHINPKRPLPIRQSHPLGPSHPTVPPSSLTIARGAMAPKKPGALIKPLMFQAIIIQISSATYYEPKVVKRVIAELTLLAAKEVAKAEKFVIPDLVTLKLRRRPATQACKKMLFGKETVVKAKPKKTMLRAAASASVGRFARDDGGNSSSSD